MGWRGRKSEIDPGMIFKKMHCKNCGAKLKIKKNTVIVNKGDENFSTRGTGNGQALGMSSYYCSTYTYLCPDCNLEISYDEQCVVAKIQKQLKKKVIKEEYCEKSIEEKIKMYKRSNKISLIIAIITTIIILALSIFFFVYKLDKYIGIGLLIIIPFFGESSIMLLKEKMI